MKVYYITNVQINSEELLLFITHGTPVPAQLKLSQTLTWWNGVKVFYSNHYRIQYPFPSIIQTVDLQPYNAHSKMWNIDIGLVMILWTGNDMG